MNRSLILGYQVEIRSDHRPLTWLLKVKTPSGRVARWQTLLSEYDFTVQYIPGRENIVADYLSRMRSQDTDMLEEEIEGRVLVVTSEENEESKVMKKFNIWNIEDLKKEAG